MTDFTPSSCCPLCGLCTPGSLALPERVAWLQINLEWAETDEPRPRHERELFRLLAEPVARARSAGLESFWFVHKDPGLRLRFGFDAPRPGAIERLEDALRGLQEQRLIRTWFKSPYEPEVFLFGGSEATAAVHRYFDADSELCLQWYLREPTAGWRVSAPVLSLGVLVDLVQRCIQPREEVWDVWCNLERVHGGDSGAYADIPLIGIRELHSLCGPVAAPVLDGYARANAALASALDTVWRSGKLLVGPRGILVSLAGFHWNRYGIERTAIQAIVNAAVRCYDPRRELAGGAIRRRTPDLKGA